jgi:hypothetical protein
MGKSFMQETQRTKTLPIEFNLKNYRDLKELNATEWLKLIQLRLRLYSLILNKEQVPKDLRHPVANYIEYIHVLDDIQKCFYLESIKQMLKHPLSTESSSQQVVKDVFEFTLFDDCLGFFLPEIISSNTHKISCVTELNAQHDFNNIYTIHSNGTAKYLRDDRPEDKASNQNHKMLDDLLKLTTQAQWKNHYPILINLARPDEEILENIAYLIKEKRRILGVKSPKKIKKTDPKIPKLMKYMTDSELDRWESLGLLPYLDLKIFEMINNREINKTAIANAIYPDPSEHNVATIYKTLNPLANYILESVNQVDPSQSIIRLLEVFSASGMSRNNKSLA